MAVWLSWAITIDVGSQTPFNGASHFLLYYCCNVILMGMNIRQMLILLQILSQLVFGGFEVQVVSSLMFVLYPAPVLLVTGPESEFFLCDSFYLGIFFLICGGQQVVFRFLHIYTFFLQFVRFFYPRNIRKIPHRFKQVQNPLN